MEKHVGVTLLIMNHQRKKLRASLLSIIFEFRSIQDLKNKIEEYCNKFNLKKIDDINNNINDLIYIGIYDVYYVSDNLTDNCMIGKTSEDEINSLDKARKLIKGIEMYDFKLLSNDKTNDFISELVYFYNDIYKNENFTITAKFYHSEKTIFETLKAIKKNANSTWYKEKIIEGSEEKLQTKRIRYLGVGDVYVKSKFAKKLEGVEAIYNDFVDIMEIKAMLPDQNDVFNLGTSSR